MEHGVRPTTQRAAVLGELLRERHDATAQELHARLRRRGSSIGLATVYRTLALLADAGIVDTLVHGHERACYRVCGSAHHHHLVCTSCHRVIEVEDCELEPWIERVAEAHGFAAMAHTLELSGVCRACR